MPKVARSAAAVAVSVVEGTIVAGAEDGGESAGILLWTFMRLLQFFWLILQLIKRQYDDIISKTYHRRFGYGDLPW